MLSVRTLLPLLAHILAVLYSPCLEGRASTVPGADAIRNNRTRGQRWHQGLCFLVRRELWEPSHALLRALDPAVSAGLSVLMHNSSDGIRAVMVPIGDVMVPR